MNIQEELKISQYQHWIQEYGCKNIPFICSLVYNLGRIQGIRDERKRRRGEVTL